MSRGTKLRLPALRQAAQQSPHGSAIVNLASTAGIVGSTQDPLCSMTKGGATPVERRCPQAAVFGNAGA